MKKQPKVKIMVGYHKPAILFKSDILFPIHLGRTLATQASKDGIMDYDDYLWLLDNMDGDDTGKNLSGKNRLYAELTALYWVWKNYEKLENPDYIGLMHYRRLLNFSNNKEDKSFQGLLDEKIVKACSGSDMILSEPLGAWSNKSKKFLDNIFEQYAVEHNREDLEELQKIIKKSYPEMAESVDKVLYHSSKISWYGIFVMKKELFFEYASFVFDVFAQLEKRIKWQKYSLEQQRVCGFLSEFLLNIFKEYKQSLSSLKVKTFPLYYIDNKDQKRVQLGVDIDVCLGTDNNYVHHTAAAMASVLKNANALDRYHFHILSEDLSLVNKRKLQKLRKMRSFTIDYPKIDRKKLDIFKKIRRPEHINMSAYVRLLIPDVLPAVNKVIYLDSDLVVLKDLNNMMSIEMKDSWFGGVEDINAPNLARCIKLPDDKYINSGVLLIDAKACRENDYLKFMQDVVEQNYQNYYICDQDVLNDAFHDKIQLISYRYNMFFKFHKLLGGFRPTDATDFADSCQDPTVVHFVGKAKPWTPNTNHPYKDIYNYYLSLTPWADYKEKGEKAEKSFKVFQKIKTPEIKQIKLFNIPIKTVKKKPHKITKRILGLLYYKKCISDSVETVYNFWGLKKSKHKLNGANKISVCANELENRMQIWRHFIFPYTVYGNSPAMLELAKQFVTLTNDARMHLLYMAMVLETGDEDTAKRLLESYTKRFGDKDFDKKLNLAYFASQHGYYHLQNIRQTADIYDAFNRVTNSAVLESLLYGKTIAVVGNGPSHLGKKKGTEIDAHDIVIRMNNYATEYEYQEDYGAKTDIWLVGCGGDDVLLRKENFKAVIFAQDVRYFWGFHSDFYKYFILEHKIPCLYISEEIIREFHQKIDIKFTTSGANLIYFLSKVLKNFKNVDFYGFNFYSDVPENYAVHYFKENQSDVERKARSSGHDFEKEALLMKELIKAKGGK